MTEPIDIVAYDDGHPRLPPGGLFYPMSLSVIRGALGELNSEQMEHPQYFNANIEWLLQLVAGFFSDVHESHGRARAIHDGYRVRRTQYAVYLRSFSSGGRRIYSETERGWVGEDVFLSADRLARDAVREALSGRLDCVSFVNRHSPSIATDEGANLDLPSFCVRDDNWREVVKEVVKGAKVVVLDVAQGSPGVAYEMELVQRCGLAERSVVLTAHSGEDALGAFGAVVVAGEGAEERLRGPLLRFAEDAFVQDGSVADLSDLPCWVVDKSIQLAKEQHDPARLRGVPYENYIPSSLATNWNLLAEHFPSMTSRWLAVEARARAGETTGTHELASIMYQACAAFLAAVTLERYFEMARSVATIGAAHRLMTREVGVMTECYRHAATFSRLGGDVPGAEYYGRLVGELTR